MSSTRHAAPGAPFSPDRFASSEKFKTPLGGLLVAKRCALLKRDSELRNLIWFIQERSLPDMWVTGRVGSLEQIADELLTHANFAPDASGLWFEHFDLRPGRIQSDHFEYVPDSAESLAEKRKSAVAGLVAGLQELALSPCDELVHLPGMEDNWRQILASYRAKCDAEIRGTLASTSVSRAVEEALVFTRETRKVSLVMCPAKHGKSEAAKVFCGASSGRARYVLTPEKYDSDALYRAVGKALGCATSDGKTAARVREIVERTCALMRPHLVFDEAHNFFSDSKRPTKEPLRVLWARRLIDLGCSVSFIALPIWQARLRRAIEHLDWEPQQLTDLIAHSVELPLGLSPADFQAIVQVRAAEFPADCQRALVTAAKNQPGAQYLINLIDVARYYAKEAGRSIPNMLDVNRAIGGSVPRKEQGHQDLEPHVDANQAPARLGARSPIAPAGSDPASPGTRHAAAVHGGRIGVAQALRGVRTGA
jgi:hypothetical protein